jgi:hypothetical protein
MRSSISTDIWQIQKENDFSILMQPIEPIGLYDLIVGSDGRREFEVTLSKIERRRYISGYCREAEVLPDHVLLPLFFPRGETLNSLKPLIDIIKAKPYN